MRRQDMSLTIALCAAIGVYSILARLAADGYTRDAGALLKTPPAPAYVQLSLERDRQRIGESTGTGDAIMNSPGELPQLAMKANQNQPFLSRDPEGFGTVGSDPSDSVFPQRMSQAPPTAPEAPPVPFGVATGENPSPAPRTRPGPTAAPAGEPTAPVADNSGQPSITSAQPAQQYVRASPSPSADPAPMSDSEIDAFSKTSSADFRSGKTSVQFGRKTRLTRPKVTISGEFDVFSLSSPRVVLEIRTSSAGDVYAVRLIRSSGSKELDLACQRAAYNWWFEPPKDAVGVARADVFPFVISFH